MNRGFLFGDGFFETMRVLDGGIPLLSFHLARARRAASLLRMEWPVELDVDFFLDLAQHTTKEVIRVDFYRSGGGQYKPESAGMAYHVSYRSFVDDNNAFVTDVPDQPALDQRLAVLASIPVTVYRAQVKPIMPIYTIKSLSALFYVEAGLKLQDEAIAKDYLLLNQKNNIAEGLSSNVLIKQGGKWLCAHPNDGGVEGVYLNFLKSELNINEVPLTEERLQEADEIYFVNAVRGFQKVHLV